MVLDAVRLKTFTPEALVSAIANCGVAFQLTPAEAASLRAQGVSTDILTAIEANFSRGGKPAAPLQPAKSKAEIIRVPAELQQARLVKQLRIEQPPHARAARLELEKSDGPVRLEVTISADGSVRSVKPLAGNAVLAEIASQTIRQWEYSPALKDGSPVPVITELQVSFSDPNFVVADNTAEVAKWTARARSVPATTNVSERINYATDGEGATIIFSPAIPFELRREMLKDPDRLALDFVGGEDMMGTKSPRTTPIEDDFTKQIRVGVPKPGSTRVVIELQAGVSVTVERLETANRVHVRLKKSGTTRSSNRPMVRGLHAIMIDAGHGGKDQGTTSPNGIAEKEITLDVSMRLGALLSERLGQSVLYTRTDDRFVELDERVRLANAAKADVFLSIHANSEPTRSVAGFETWVAARAADGQDSAKHSRALASYVNAALQIAHPSGARSDIRSGSFVVLSGAHMASVLTEIGFLSSSGEERSLSTPAYRQRVAEALFEGITSYLAGLERLQVARTF
jgi:N-acetylmuramoyl-L-alanine amidase